MAKPHIKFSDTDSWNFGMEATILIKDKYSLTKRASDLSLLKYAKTKDQEDLHLIAVGAYEGTGFNRNMDRFKEYWCEKNAHYFKDSDRAVHRHHKNKPDSPKFGNIKAAAYNKDMRRIELIVGLDKDACQDILHEQEKVGHTNWSMASKQAYDTCTWCNHKAASDDERCSHIPAKLGEMNKEGAICGMDNPNPRWFEISYVKRPADRIGMSLKKMAGSNLKPMLTRDYLEIYTDFTAPDDFVISKNASDKRALLSKISELEKYVDGMGTKLNQLASLGETEKLAADIVDELRKLNPDSFFKSAADKGIILSPDNFFSYVFADRVKEANINGAKSLLKDIYQVIEKDAGVVVNSEIFDINDRAVTSKQVTKLANSHSLFDTYVNARVVQNLSKEAANKQTDKSSDPLDKELAITYANYKLATFNYLDSNNKLSDDLIITALLQHR